ncbi:pyridoxal-phosphate dependent enzyme [Saprospira sp. CCB-QB6]|uniref:pyridoxal-phosphate dependent enzyme n=1 Tax=Saprospira sp. CCB-QB6 TaxID=3023936 RepID=UPI00234A9A16|nr:pyridoxal-phosphate dependent enzyme [Saprospira sp. CCB-QB6]WCL80266.1 pyridoxal-phosphate dependent enzyme [Saprospira sp. CCB-QB6]
MASYYNNILETIGNTPLVKLNKIVKEIPATILAKVETTNPGNSVKDRMALKMVEDAEKAGLLKPGGTIIECTSGNTGMGIAIAAVVKGYKCIFTTTDKQSKEKVDILRAVGAEVIVCPTNVGPEDPRSYYSVAERLSKEIPNSFWCNQYDNLSNRLAHYESTGPEIWEQTEGKITHFVVGVGTGGTISGVGRYLKEQNPNIKIWGIDPYGSVFKKYHETGVFDEKEIYPYVTEGIGEDILPKNVDFEIIDHFEKVTDKDAAIGTRELARQEGIMVGNSAGSAIMGIKQLASELKEDDVVVVLFHDHGSRYVGKMFNDEWMRERGFLDDELKVKDLIAKKDNSDFFTLKSSQTVKEALQFMKAHDLSQLPLVDTAGEIVGAITETLVLSCLLENPMSNSERPLSEIMAEPFPTVDLELSVKKVGGYFNHKIPAVIAVDKAGIPHIITKYDMIQTIG